MARRSRQIDREKEGSIDFKKGTNRKILGFVLVAVGVLNSMFQMKAGLDERSFLSIGLIAVGAILFFTGVRKTR